MLAAYLTDKDKALIGAGVGLVAGFLIAMMSSGILGEKEQIITSESQTVVQSSIFHALSPHVDFPNHLK